MQTSTRSTTELTQHGDLPRTENDGGNSWKRLLFSLGLARDDDDDDMITQSSLKDSAMTLVLIQKVDCLQTGFCFQVQCSWVLRDNFLELLQQILYRPSCPSYHRITNSVKTQILTLNCYHISLLQWTHAFNTTVLPPGLKNWLENPRFLLLKNTLKPRISKF